MFKSVCTKIISLNTLTCDMKSENVFTEISQEVNSSAYMYDFIECVLRVKYPKKNDHGGQKGEARRMKEKKLNLRTSPHRKTPP